VVDGQPYGLVAQELGMTVNAVTLAKKRVLDRFREEFKDLVELKRSP
jgi:hypothetical protein